MTTRPTPTPWPSFLVNGSLGILIGRSANTANSSNDQIAPIPPNGPPEKVVKRRLSASSATTENRNTAFNPTADPDRLVLQLRLSLTAVVSGGGLGLVLS